MKKTKRNNWLFSQPILNKIFVWSTISCEEKNKGYFSECGL
jgi:hypothetical protein